MSTAIAPAGSETRFAHRSARCAARRGARVARGSLTAALLAGALFGAAGPAVAATAEIGAVREIGAAEAPSGLTAGGFAVQVAETAGSYAVPAGFSTVTAWSHSAGGTAGRLTFKVFRPTGPTRQFVAVASDSRTIVPSSVQTFAVRIAVAPGDRIGLSSDDVELAFATGSRGDQIGFFDGDVPVGAIRATDGEPFEDYKLDVSATLDSTQLAGPGTPGPTAGQPGGTGSPRSAPGPAVTSLRLAPPAFRAARRGPTVRPARARRAGMKVSVRVGAPTKVRFSVRRLRGGRRSGTGRSARCVAATRRNRKASRCLREIPMRGKFTRWARRGVSFRFTGRLRGRTLRRGSYRLFATPVPRARGVRSVRASFRVR